MSEYIIFKSVGGYGGESELVVDIFNNKYDVIKHIKFEGEYFNHEEISVLKIEGDYEFINTRELA